MRSLELKLTPAQAHDPDEVRRIVEGKLRSRAGDIVPVRRSVDARKGEPLVVLTVDVYRPGEKPPEVPPYFESVGDLQSRVLIVGAGPAGYFAALELLLLGCKPVVLERGKDTRARRYDLRAIMQESLVNPHSNYCFGEGGAGTYSDGKLYTRADKRGEVRRVLQMLVEHGARREILVDAHPHIGSNRLPGVVERLRETVLRCGGEIHFDTPVTGLILEEGKILGVVGGGREFRGDAVILATGHSARDIFEMLSKAGLALEFKPFAMGVRIEHPQPLIDEIQYRQSPRDPHLPAASYRLVTQACDRGVYSFCMCPGGLIVPAATAPGEIVVNGMSMSGRNSRWANSGIVCEVRRENVGEGPLAGMEFQRSVERKAFTVKADESQRAPAQRLTDFLAGKVSADLPRCSYVPGLVPVDLRSVLPEFISESLAAGLQHFGSRMRGFLTEEAVLVGVESRTSSPVRVPRDADTLAHPQLENFYPCGEGAGYAGGIVSAAMDGQRVARAVAARLAASRA